MFLWRSTLQSRMGKVDFSQLVCRLATIDDYAGVMEISKGIYSGLDYLPAMYMTFLHDKRANLVVAEYEGKVVSANLICTCYIIQLICAWCSMQLICAWYSMQLKCTWYCIQLICAYSFQLICVWCSISWYVHVVIYVIDMCI